MKTIELTIKKNKATAYDRWDVKHGRKLKASIYRKRDGADVGRYQIVVNGLAFYRDTLEGAKDFVIGNLEGFLDMVGFGAKVTIREK